jgi:hypothetical protein
VRHIINALIRPIVRPIINALITPIIWRNSYHLPNLHTAIFDTNCVKEHIEKTWKITTSKQCTFPSSNFILYICIFSNKFESNWHNIRSSPDNKKIEAEGPIQYIVNISRIFNHAKSTFTLKT